MTRIIHSWYVVQIKTMEGGQWEYSRSFTRLANARKWAQWCLPRWPTQIYRGGPGGEQVPVQITDQTEV